MEKVKFFNFIVCLLLVMAGCNDDNNLSSRKDKFDLKKINYQAYFMIKGTVLGAIGNSV